LILRGHEILLNSSIFPVENLGNDGAFHPQLATFLATVADGYVVLILVPIANP